MTPKQREAVVAEVVLRVRVADPESTIRGVASAHGVRRFIRFDLDEVIEGRAGERPAYAVWTRPVVGSESVVWEPRIGVEWREHLHPPPGMVSQETCSPLGDGPCNGGRAEMARFVDLLVEACLRLRPVDPEAVARQLRFGERYVRGERP